MRHHRSRSSTLARVTLLSAILGAAAGCANRQLVTSTVMREVQREDPKLGKIRVYPTVTYVVVYTRALGDDFRVNSNAGTLNEDVRGRRIEVEVKRSLPGAIVAVDALEDQPLLWITFDDACTAQDCAFGFVRSDDGKFRLCHVPLLPGYSEPTVFRKRLAPRKMMEKTKIFSKSKGASVYFTMRGQIASIALEVKKRKRVDIVTSKNPQRGVKPRG
jgi:hypothetical protein